MQHFRTAAEPEDRLFELMDFFQFSVLPILILSAVLPALTLYLAWRAVTAVERIAHAAEQIERNTRQRKP